jgi:alginate O-acetyltransferase complex protein AlgJ
MDSDVLDRRFMQTAARHSRFRRRLTALVLPALVLTTLFTFGFHYAVVGVRSSDLSRWADLLRSEPVGNAPAEIERDFNQRFLPSVAARTLLFGTGAPAVRALGAERVTAADGTIFIREDIDVCHTVPFLSRADGRPREAIKVIAALAGRLRERGIRLIVVPVPAKASIYPDRLFPEYDVSGGPDLNSGHHAWISALQTAGVEVFDPSEVLWQHRGETLYFKTDTHWSPRAMEFTATALADYIRPFLDASTPQRRFDARVERHSMQGDLSESPGQAGMETFEFSQIWKVDTSPAFGDDASILVTGDSNVYLLQERSGGFAQLLAFQLQRDVQSLGTWGVRAPAMIRHVEESQARLDGKKVVVLAFAIRKLLTDEWQSQPPMFAR